MFQSRLFSSPLPPVLLIVIILILLHPLILLLLSNLSRLAGTRKRLARLLIKQPIRLLARLANLFKDGGLEIGLGHHGGGLCGKIDLEGFNVCGAGVVEMLAHGCLATGEMRSGRGEVWARKVGKGREGEAVKRKEVQGKKDVPPLSLSLFSTRVTAPEQPPQVMATEYL